MSFEMKPPATPGEAWRVDMHGCTFAVDDKGNVRCWWPAGRSPVGWDEPLPPTDSESRNVLIAWALHERARADKAEKIAAAERAYRVEPQAMLERLSSLRAHGCDGAADKLEREYEPLCERLLTALVAAGVDP